MTSATTAPGATKRGAVDGVGITDVAALAGVSPSTVSNVLNHRERVAAATIERVERAIELLGYVPNGAARSLVAGHSRSIGLVLSDLGNSLFVDIARGAERAADELGLSVVLANSDGRLEREDRYVELLTESRVRGLLLTLNDESHFREIAARSRQRGPLILLNLHADDGRFCTVSIDNEAGGALAAAHLLATGRRRLAFVGGPDSLQPIADRRAGVRRALASAGLAAVAEIGPEWINRADGWQVGRMLAPRIAAGEIDGVVAASDLLAAGIVQALAETPGIRVPEDVGVIGYDNNQAAWDAPVPLSTVAQPGEALGETGVRLLVAESDDPTHRHQAVRLDPTVVVRRSTER
ncbi:LacI family DNA-binding transcriptional regulator [Agromyces seonyuensis]|uniref:LacI family DNA-binding transcriptional regulator n=1 Tax=Agromyces seonyuensis TaxID=2662446 RepID=A0A6I4P5P0_9MICO|nr:LacI family DNA-binding transcriptional regulator [Agromyces seonyuensis]MWB98877.1 LacI family DNA-binding transcriptional regulator [Agromyces seonyuensis]